MRTTLIFLAACGASQAPYQTPRTAAPVSCADAPRPVVVPLVVDHYPIARVPLTEEQRHSRADELGAKHPGWRFTVTQYGAIESIGDGLTAEADFPTAKVASLLATLEREELLPPLTEKLENERHLYYVGDQPRGWAQIFRSKTPFLDIRFLAASPDFPTPPHAHLLSIAELFDRWDPSHNHTVVQQLLIAPMPCDQVPGEHCPGTQESPAPTCSSVRELSYELVVLGAGDGHQRLVYSLHATNGAIMQMTLPRCYDAFTGDAVDSCP